MEIQSSETVHLAGLHLLLICGEMSLKELHLNPISHPLHIW